MKIYLEIENQMPGLLYYGAVTDGGKQPEFCTVGTIVSRMEARHKTDTEYLKAAEADIHYLLEGEPEFDEMPFYAVPAMEVFARDSRGGLFARDVTGECCCYVDRDGACYRLTETDDLKKWRDHLERTEDFVLYENKAAAEAALGEKIQKLKELTEWRS